MSHHVEHLRAGAGVAALRAEPARRDVVVRTRDVLSILLCTGRWKDREDPVCRSHGFMWEEDRALCNRYDEPTMEALLLLSELGNSYSRERAAHRALRVRVGDIADWHEGRADRFRKRPGFGKVNRRVRQEAVRRHADAAAKLRDLLRRP